MQLLPWAIYSRVSTDEQAEEGASLQAQMAACSAYAAQRQWTVAHELVDDGYTGRNTKRPGYQKLLSLINARSIAGVITWKLKRLNRNSNNSGHLVELIVRTGVELVMVAEHWDTTTPVGRAMMGVAAIFAQLESEETGVQTSLAMQYLKSKGYYTGGSVPPGCRVITVDDGKRKRLEPNEHGEALKQAWEWVLTGYSLRDVAAKLDMAGVPSGARQGKVTRNRWTATGVRNVLLSSQMAGVLTDKDTQARVRAMLGSRIAPGRAAGRGQAEVAGAKARHPSILAGIFRCPSCGGAVCQVTATGNGGAYRYFRCIQANKSRLTCAQRDLRCEPIEREVLAEIAKACQPGGDYTSSVMRGMEVARRSHATAKEERARLMGERDQLSARVSTLTLETQIGTAGWKEAMKVVGAQLERIDRRLAELQGTIAAARVDEGSLDAALAAVAAYTAKLGELEESEQREVLRDLVRSVKFEADNLVIELYEPTAPGEAGDGSCKSQNMGSRRHATRTVIIRRPCSMNLRKSRKARV